MLLNVDRMQSWGELTRWRCKISVEAFGEPTVICGGKEFIDMHGVLRSYLFYVVPMIAIPVVLHLLMASIDVRDLILVGLLFPFYALAAKGLSFHFPPENLARRSIGTMIEHALLEGLLFCAFMLFFFRLTVRELSAEPLEFAELMAVMALSYAAICFWTARREQKRLRGDKS